MSNVSLVNGHDDANYCVCCGEEIPEGKQVCEKCESEVDTE